MNALDQLPAELGPEHAKRLADAHRSTAARCRALGYPHVAALYEKLAAACLVPAKLARASAALEGPALRVVTGGAGDQPRTWGGLDEKAGA